jgi:hypothetical protein
MAVFGVSALQAAVGRGTTGYFIARSYGCEREFGPTRVCGWAGEFQLANGTVIGTAFGYTGKDPAMRAGTKVPALDPGGSLDTAFPRQWNWTWLPILLVALGACVGSALWFWAALRAARRNRAGS